jgi:hypothetical protein
MLYLLKAVQKEHKKSTTNPVIDKRRIGSDGCGVE